MIEKQLNHQIPISFKKWVYLINKFLNDKKYQPLPKCSLELKFIGKDWILRIVYELKCHSQLKSGLN